MLLCLAASTPSAQEKVYAFIIGVNESPSPELQALRYADDDAARYAELFARLDARVALFTVPDRATSARYARAIAQAQPPRWPEIVRTVTAFREAMIADRAHGDVPLLYIVYSGHGAAKSDGRVALALLGDDIDETRLYERIIDQLPAYATHLWIDACHAAAVVGRGKFAHETDAKPADAATNPLETRPTVGAFLASAAGQSSHEWSRIEAGVFSHVLLSGLSGAADVNADGSIEYSELHAFVRSASRTVEDPRAVPHVVVITPRATPRARLLVLDRLRDVAWLEGSPAHLGHFSIELGNGARFLDAHLLMDRVRLYVPANSLLYVRRDGDEAILRMGPGERTDIGALTFGRNAVTERGSIDAALTAGMFAAPFSVDYYSGFADSTGALPVPFAQSIRTPRPAWLQPLAIAATVAGSAALVTMTASSVVAVMAQQAFAQTDLQRPAAEAANRHAISRSIAIGASITTAVFSAVSIWLFRTYLSWSKNL